MYKFQVTQSQGLLLLLGIWDFSLTYEHVKFIFISVPCLVCSPQFVSFPAFALHLFLSHSKFHPSLTTKTTSLFTRLM